MKPARMEWLDYTRFAAAFSVLFFHYFYYGPLTGRTNTISGFEPLNLPAAYGYLGVDLFFVLSGFVILHSAANRPADQFAVGRAVRLYPAFLFCMTFTAVLSQVWGGGKMTATLLQWFANLTMFPYYLGYLAVDGVYWTLMLEIAFYGAVFLIILFGLMRHIQTIITCWLAVLLTLNLLGVKTHIPLFGDYFVLFAGGCILALVYRDGFSVAKSSLLAVAIGLSVYTAIGRSVVLSDLHGSALSPVIVGGVVLCFYLPFLIFRHRRFADLRLPQAQLVGALTYPLYLLHAHFGYMVMGRFGNDANKWLVVSLQILLVLALSLAVHLVVERAAKRFWVDLFDRTIGAPVRRVMRSRLAVTP